MLINKKVLLTYKKGLLSIQKDLLTKKKDLLTQKNGLLNTQNKPAANSCGKFLRQIATVSNHYKYMRRSANNANF